MDIFHMSDVISLIGLPYPPSGHSTYNIPCQCCDDKPGKKHLNINLKMCIRDRVNTLQVEPLNESSPLYGNLSAFASGISQDAVEDTAKNLGLAMRVDGECYPLRMTAYKSLLDRAKIGGTALPKLGRDVLAETLNACLHLYSAEALLLIRDEKIAAVHSGDPSDYSVLPINELLSTLTRKLDERFPGAVFELSLIHIDVYKRQDEYIDNVDDDMVLVGVDYHI